MPKKLEGDLNSLFHNLTNMFQKTIPLSGFNIEHTKNYVELSKILRNCANSILELGLASTLINKPKNDLQISYSKKSKDFKLKDLINETYGNLALNPKNIENIICTGISCGGSEDIGKQKQAELRKILLKLQEHELSLTLSKHLSEYENSILRNIILQFMNSLEKCQKEVEKVFDNLENKSKEFIYEKLSVFFNKKLKNSILAKLLKKGKA